MSYTIEKYVDQGSRSSFYKLTNRGKGFKTFCSKYDAEYAHKVQKTLAEYDLAPRVYSEVGRIKRNGKFTEWGYITEIAKTLQPKGCAGNCGCTDCCDDECYYSDEIYQLQSDIEDLGFYFGDAHIGNIGYVRRNGVSVMVCIDTGYESVDGGGYDEDEDDGEDDNDLVDTGCNCVICVAWRRDNG